MSKRKYEVTQEEPEVVLEDDVKDALQEMVYIAQTTGQYDMTPLEVSVAVEEVVLDKPSTEAIAAGKTLTGSPDTYNFPVGVVNQLLHFGIAADAGDGTLMRGYRWFQYYN